MPTTASKKLVAAILIGMLVFTLAARSLTNLATQVTGVLAVVNGGTGTASTLTGLVRGSGTAMTAAELSGDVTTSGSNAATLAKLNVNATPNDYIAGGGTAQAQTATLAPALSANTTGATLKFLPVAANTAAAPTLAVNGLTAKTITKCGTVALVANDLITTQPAEVQYDGTEWVLQNPMAIGCAAPKLVSNGFFAPTQNGATAVTAVPANTTRMWSVMVPTTQTSTKVGYEIITTADNTTNLYDIGYYDNSGTLVCHLGATAGTIFAPSTGVKGSLSWTSSCTLIGGNRYYLAMTDNVATATVGGLANTLVPVCAANPSANSATSGGVLNSSVTPPADSVTAVCTLPLFLAF
jgi:hypothetical protein